MYIGLRVVKKKLKNGKDLVKMNKNKGKRLYVSVTLETCLSPRCENIFLL